MSDWLDEETSDHPIALRAQVPATVEDPIARVRAFDNAWSKLTVAQKTFLTTWKESRFNAARAYRKLGMTRQGDSRWMANESYAVCKKILKLDAVGDVLERERLILRQDDCAEQLLKPKPILYQGNDTGFRENNPAAAAKVNEVLLRVGGHLRDEQALAPVQGPALIVQVTNKIGGEVVETTTIGVTPELPAPDESWIDGDS